MDDPRFNDDLAPEAHNSEQDDEGAQAQTVADEALRGGGETLSDSEKVPGGDPGDGTLLAGAHRAFINLKEAVTGSDDQAIINEIERGEDYLKGKFEAALKNVDLAPEARSAVDQAWTSVKAGHDEMSGLKHNRERAQSYREGQEDATVRQQEYASESDRNRRDDQIA